MFNLNEWVKEAIIDSVKEGRMAECTARLATVGYMDKGILTITEVEEIAEAIKVVVAEPIIETPVEEVVAEPIV